MNKITRGDMMKTEVDFVDGILLILDIARKVLAKDKSPQRVNVYEIMTKPVITVDKFMDIRYCARLFEQFHLFRAPVLKKDQVTGMISYTDMVTKGLSKAFNIATDKGEKP